jgi:hypothetical protein
LTESDPPWKKFLDLRLSYGIHQCLASHIKELLQLNILQMK